MNEAASEFVESCALIPLPMSSEGRSAEAESLRKRAETYQSYTAEQKAEVLALFFANGQNMTRTAREADIPIDTLRYWVRHADRFSQLQPQKSVELADKLENLAHKLADSMDSHDLSIVPLVGKASTFGVVVDKMQLLRGQPTSITSDPVSAAADVCTMLKELCTNPEFREKVRESIQSRACGSGDERPQGQIAEVAQSQQDTDS